ncbi:subtilisin-like protease SBT5.6 [Andrographis paniculata]|uniref:subtilisin-like protease SBT5.6 n=1 Tax=Andrographis paniculata TaxID=175694 RepID=UPI0021E74A05|nr:subtilisin-like protease SBT5.6 [Andrographis paniculata]
MKFKKKSCEPIKVLLLLIITTLSSTAFADTKVYIVRLSFFEEYNNKLQSNEDHYLSYLLPIKGSLEKAKASFIYVYTNVLYGFAAILSPVEALLISEMYGVISVVESKSNELQTSRSWDFITSYESLMNSLQEDDDELEELMRRANNVMDVVVGVLDSGIWPESQSFNDNGMAPVPETWKGICQVGAKFPSNTCNRKLIGARYFVAAFEAMYGPVDPQVEYRSARDKNGHGTHVASTVGGRVIDNAAAVGGFGLGRVRGGVPDVRLAVYKICWVKRDGSTVCEDADMLAAFEAAINDGVDVINLSHGGMDKPYTQDANAIGSLQAAKFDIAVAAAAGNAGPAAGTVANVAPWMITVAASSIDRVFQSEFLLGNGFKYQGQSITPVYVTGTYELVYAGYIEIPGSTTIVTSGQCRPGTLSEEARGRVVVCFRGMENPRPVEPVSHTEQALEVRRAGGVAALLHNLENGIGVSLQPFPVPAIVVINPDMDPIITYLQRTGTITLYPPTTVLPSTPAPFMAEFSSTGPNTIQYNLLKPDVTAPGLNILAASTTPNTDNAFVFKSGTSFASPHVAAVLAYLKALHPSWSSAAMISAIMTTAKVIDTENNPIKDAFLKSATPFNYGSGHIRPSKAADPGLIYDITYAEYIDFACASTGQSLDPEYQCPAKPPPPSNLNYPSLAIANVGSQGTTVPRRVRNVGGGSPTYTVSIVQPPGYIVKISPATLNFNPGVKTQSFTISVQASASAARNQFAFGSYTWRSTNGAYLVRSPIAVAISNIISETTCQATNFTAPFHPLQHKASQ